MSKNKRILCFNALLIVVFCISFFVLKPKYSEAKLWEISNEINKSLNNSVKGTIVCKPAQAKDSLVISVRINDFKISEYLPVEQKQIISSLTYETDNLLSGMSNTYKEKYGLKNVVSIITDRNDKILFAAHNGKMVYKWSENDENINIKSKYIRTRK